MLQSMCYFFGLFFIALVMVLWEWRGVFVWQITHIRQNKHIPKKTYLLKSAAFGFIAVVKQLCQHVFLKDGVKERQGKLSVALPFIGMFLVFFSFLWLPLTPNFPAVPYVYSSLVVMFVLALIMLGRVFIPLHGVNHHHKTTRVINSRSVWLVMCGWLLMTASIFNMGVVLNTFDLGDMVLGFVHTPIWQRVFGVLGFGITSFVLLHRYNLTTESIQNVLNTWQESHVALNNSAPEQLENQVNEALANEQVIADDKESAKEQQEMSDKGIVEPPFFLNVNASRFATKLTDYLLLISLSAIMVLVFLGGWLPWFDVEQLLPETWFFLKLFLVLLTFFMFKMFYKPFYDVFDAVSHDTISDERRSDDPQRSFTWLVYFVAPIVLVHFVINVIGMGQ